MGRRSLLLVSALAARATARDHSDVAPRDDGDGVVNDDGEDRIDPVGPGGGANANDGGWQTWDIGNDNGRYRVGRTPAQGGPIRSRRYSSFGNGRGGNFAAAAVVVVVALYSAPMIFLLLSCCGDFLHSTEFVTTPSFSSGGVAVITSPGSVLVSAFSSLQLSPPRRRRRRRRPSLSRCRHHHDPLFIGSSSSRHNTATGVSATTSSRARTLLLGMKSNGEQGTTMSSQVPRKSDATNNQKMTTTSQEGPPSSSISGTSTAATTTATTATSTTRTSETKTKTTAWEVNNSNAAFAVVPGPSLDTKPDYDNIVGPLGRTVDQLFLSVFRNALAKEVLRSSGNAAPASSASPDDDDDDAKNGNKNDNVSASSLSSAKKKLERDAESLLRSIDPNKNDYDTIIQLATYMNRRFSDKTEIHRRSQHVLRSLFPSWLPGSYAELFSKPQPEFSSRMNAWATKLAGTWLMGECEINDVEVQVPVVGVGDDGAPTNGTRTVMMKDQGLLVKRCRFLEESRCASICVNSCKVPTQNFFLRDMGLPLTMEPDYDTFECQFSFGKMPTEETEFDASATPCLSMCPTMGSLRKMHNGGEVAPIATGITPTSSQVEDGSVEATSSPTRHVSPCVFMEGDDDGR